MDSEIVQAQDSVKESFAEYEELKSLKHPLKANFLLIFHLQTDYRTDSAAGRGYP
jgi:hypothetical protein